MLREFLRAKLHRAVVTDTERDYMGSISIDPALMRAASIAPLEKVEVYNVDNGERFSTYAIEGEPGRIGLNGAAAHKGEPGQRVIIAAYCWLSQEEIAGHTPSIVLLDGHNVPLPRQ